MYQVMLPCLALFTLLTIILYFVSIYTDKEHIEKCKKSAARLKSSFRRSMEDSLKSNRTPNRMHSSRV